MSPVLCLLFAALMPAARAAEAPEDSIARSVVKIYTTFRHPDYFQPWQMSAEDGLSGSGCLVSGGRILTNAHVVADSVFVQVRKAGDPTRYPAKVEFIANDAELALLTVADDNFRRGTSSLELGPLPQRRDQVSAYGFPDGGDDLSITQGIVSRVEVMEYTHSGRELLALQTDAAIDPGNSGGPLVKGGKLVGVSFQMDIDGRKAGYAVPAPVISRFLEDVKDGSYQGVPDLGVRWETAENRAKREYLGMGPSDTGIRVTAVAYGSSAWGRLEPGDILRSVDGTTVSDDGTVPFRRQERVLFTSLIDARQAGQTAVLDVLRAGRALRLSVPLKVAPGLVRGPDYGVRPTYFVYAGLIFTPLTRNYIETWEDYGQVPTGLKYWAEYGLPTPERKEVVLLSHVLADSVNVGYHDLRDLSIASVNGRPIAGMRDLVEAFRKPQGRFHVIETEPEAPWRSLLVLDAAAAERASAEIIRRYGLPADRSADLK